MKAYHFLKADMRTGAGNEPAWEIGQYRAIPPTQQNKIALCQYGYHASPTLWDALQYAEGPMACLVQVPKASAKDDSKSVHVSRKLLDAVNIERELRLFAADCAEHVLYIFERECPNDDRPRQAIQAARDFANGKIRDAARDAAGAAARDAAGAPAGDAAWDAARAAAGAAAGARCMGRGMGRRTGRRRGRRRGRGMAERIMPSSMFATPYRRHSRERCSILG